MIDNQSIKMNDSESIGAIKVSNMIWTATLLTLGSLGLCWTTTSVANPTIMQSAMQYPYTIIFRIGMMYSLFIIFLELLFIKWWIDSFPISRHTTLMVVVGTIGLAAYGLFVSCIDRKRINYVLSSDAVTVASLATTICIYIIMKNLSLNRYQGITLANEQSWILKRAFALIYFSGISIGVLVYTGYIDIDHKPLVEYITVISASLFFWTFSLDFKKFKMDVERVTKPQAVVVQVSQ